MLLIIRSTITTRANFPTDSQMIKMVNQIIHTLKIIPEWTSRKMKMHAHGNKWKLIMTGITNWKSTNQLWKNKWLKSLRDTRMTLMIYKATTVDWLYQSRECLLTPKPLFQDCHQITRLRLILMIRQRSHCSEAIKHSNHSMKRNILITMPSQKHKLKPLSRGENSPEALMV